MYSYLYLRGLANCVDSFLYGERTCSSYGGELNGWLWLEGGGMHAVHVWRCSKLLVVVLLSFVFQSMLQSRQWFPVTHSRSSNIYYEWLKHKVKSILQCISISHLLYGIKKIYRVRYLSRMKAQPYKLPNNLTFVERNMVTCIYWCEQALFVFDKKIPFGWNFFNIYMYSFAFGFLVYFCAFFFPVGKKKSIL